MKKIFLITLVTLAVTAVGAFAQMGGGQHMMGSAQQPQVQTQQGGQPYTGMMGYGMQPGMMTGYGMQPMMPGYGMQPGMMGGYGMYQPMPGYGMQPGMMGGYGMHQPMMGYGTGHMHSGMMGSGVPHMYQGAGGSVEKQREFLQATSKLRKELHDLMFNYMEARWNPETEPEQLENMRKKMQGLQQEIYEKSGVKLK